MPFILIKYFKVQLLLVTNNKITLICQICLRHGLFKRLDYCKIINMISKTTLQKLVISKQDLLSVGMILKSWPYLIPHEWSVFIVYQLRTLPFGL